MRIMRIVIISLGFVLINLTGFTQRLQKISKIQRDSCLNQIALKTIQKYAEEDFYTEITTHTIDSTIIKDRYKKEYEVYVVTYYYDKKKFRMHEEFLMKIFIEKKTGKAINIGMGTGGELFIKHGKPKKKIVMQKFKVDEIFF